jgi:hypothetical protein
VPDCRQAHQSYVNDFSTGICQWCGEYCHSCNYKTGCESCSGVDEGAGYALSTDYNNDAGGASRTYSDQFAVCSSKYYCHNLTLLFRVRQLP